jgi:capsular exopolysaccharide synthesis family protein
MIVDNRVIADSSNTVTEFVNRVVARPASGVPEAIRYTRTRPMPVDIERLRDLRRVVDAPDDPASHAFKMLRTQVMFWLAERGGSCLAVTSPGRGEGKTSTAVNLAVHLAAEVDYTVLLVDADLRSPAIHQYLGWPEVRGLSDHLATSAPLEELLLNPQIGRLVVLPAGSPVLNSAEMLGSRAMANLVEEFKTRYPRRIVVFDLPPVLETTDALALSRHVDGVLMVAAQGRTHKRDLIRAQTLLGVDKLIGLTLNRATG